MNANEKIRKALEEASTWLEALVSEASPGSEDSTHEVVKTIASIRDALAALAEAAAVPLDVAGVEPVAFSHPNGAVWRADNCPDYIKDDVRKSEGWVPLWAADALASLAARLEEAQTGHAAARENFLTMQDAANKLRLRAEAAEAENDRLRGELARVERETIERCANTAACMPVTVDVQIGSAFLVSGGSQDIAAAIRALEPRHD